MAPATSPRAAHAGVAEEVSRSHYGAGTGQGFGASHRQGGFRAAARATEFFGRIWKAGDTVEVVMPKALRIGVPDNPSRFALMWGRWC